MRNSVLILIMSPMLSWTLANAAITKSNDSVVDTTADTAMDARYTPGGGSPSRSQTQSRPAPMPQPRIEQRQAPMPQARPMPQPRIEQRPAPMPRPMPMPQPRIEQRPAPMPRPMPMPQPRVEQRPTTPQPQPRVEQRPTTPVVNNTPRGENRPQTQPTRQEGNQTRNARIEPPAAPRAPLKGSPVVNKDKSVTEHYQDGSSLRRGTDGKVISQYDASSHKVVYSNKDGSTTIAQGARSVRTYQNGDKVVRNAANHQVSTFNAAKNQTVVRSPGRQVLVDHRTGIVQVQQGRTRYEQVPRADGRGFTRSVTINNVNITRIYNYNYNRFGGRSAYYYPGIYVTPYFPLFTGGFYGGFGYLASAGYYVNPWNYGWSIWRTYPAQVCWWGGCNYAGYGFYPYTPAYTWRADYGYYYTPVISIINPIDYILGTLVAESLENRRQARLDAEAIVRQDQIDRAQAIADAARDDEDQAQLLRNQAADELAAAQAETARNASVVQDRNEAMSQEAIDAQKTTINHVTTEIAQKNGNIDVIDFLTSDKGVHGFQIHDTLTVGVDGSDNQCNLDQGDVVEVNPGFAVTKDTENVLVKVLSAVPGDCRPGKVVNIGIEKLQDMLNATVEKVNDAMNDMATKKMGQQK